MIFCSHCGNMTKKIFVEGDSRKRDICVICNQINYVNPKIIVGVLPVKDDAVLLCKRAIEPSINKWTFPSGFMEMDESLEDGAKREAFEEAKLEYEVIKLYGSYSIPDIGQVLFVYLGRIINEDFRASDETLEVKLFMLNKIPWGAIAFPSVKFFLERYVSDYHNKGGFKFHSNYL